MMRPRRASLFIALCLLGGCAPRWEPTGTVNRTAPNAQAVLSTTQRLREKTGIDGDPIRLDSSDPQFNDYLDRVRRMIKEKWAYPCIRDLATGHCDYKTARVVIVFGILKDGRVPGSEVAEQSDYGIYDDYATNAIRLAQPFPPPPEAMLKGHDGVPIVAAFEYLLMRNRWWPW